MKNISLKFALVMTLLFTSTVTFAGKPARCPAANKIKAVPFTINGPSDDGSEFYAASINKFGSNFTWGFVIAVPRDQAVNSQDALNKANAALGTLSGNPQPTFIEGRWVCLYNNSYQYMSAAVTPIN